MDVVVKQLAYGPNSTRATGEPLASVLALTDLDKENLTKNPIFNSLKTFGACALLAAACLSAQSGYMIVNIPFDFSVKNQHLTAGNYTVTTDIGHAVVLIRGEEEGSPAMFALTTPTQAPKIQVQPKLVFNRYGDRYFLTQVWQATTDQGRILQPSKAEQELARSVGKPQVVALLAVGPKSPRTGR